MAITNGWGICRAACIAAGLACGSVWTAHADMSAGRAALEKDDFASAILEFTREADNGNGEAAYALGDLYRGNKLGPADYKTALKHFERAAELGHLPATNEIGRFHAEGLGVDKDRVTAIKWWQKAADQDFGPSQYNLAVSHELGNGVRQDYIAAVTMYSRAARQGLHLAMYRLATLLERGLGAPKNIVNAINWYRGAAEKGYGPAAFRLGEIFAGGTDVRRDLDRAKVYYKQAADKGHPEAKKRLEGLDAVAAAPPPARPAAPKPGPSIEYKGRTIIGTTYPNYSNDEFFDTVKKAIDMVEDLPEDLRVSIGSIRRIIYDPPSPQRRKDDAIENAVGIYLIGNFNEPAPMVVYKDMRYSAPFEIAISLVGNSLNAEDHLRMIKVSKRLNELKASGDTSSEEFKTAQREFGEYMAIVEKTDQKLLQIYSCKAMKRTFDVFKAWDIRPDELDAISRSMSNRDCWNLLPKT